jgi:hypothetical protein
VTTPSALYRSTAHSEVTLAAREGFDTTVAARTRAFHQIFSTPEPLAEISNHAQGSARSDGRSVAAEVCQLNARVETPKEVLDAQLNALLHSEA